MTEQRTGPDTLTSRPLTPADIEAVAALASACVRNSAPRKGYAHPGDVRWRAYGPRAAEPDAEDARLWLDGLGVVAAAWFEAPTLEFLVRPDAPLDAAAEPVVAWAESRRTAAGIEPPLSTPVLVSDAARAEVLRSLGFGAARTAGTQFAYPLDAPLPAALLPSGARLRHATDSDVAARASLHRRAWSVWGPSSATTENYRAMRAVPGYDATLDIVLEWRGELLSYCVCWADAASGTAVFEPVGTNRDYAGHGFARAVLAEGLYRLRARGFHTAFVGTAAVNERALALYPTFGFREADTLVHWERRA
ncbi:MAG: GNAT family N-acetyltransferase [Dehalococcoidia bacterium]